DNGYYTGNLTFMNSQNDTFTVPISVVVDIPVASFQISVIDDASLGTVVKGQGSISFTIEINNSGSKPITNMSLDVPKLNIQKDIRKNGSFITLQPGELVNVTVTSDAAALPAGDYTSGNEAQVTVTAAGGASASTQVSLTVVRNVNDEISQLESNLSSWNQTIKQLPEGVSASKMGDIRDKFSNYRQKVNGAREAWNNGNYQEAESRYEEARQLKSDLQKLISEAQSAPSDDEPSTNETDGGNGGGNGGGGGGGGFNILFLLIPLIILIIIGVIIYLSIVPEEEASQDEGGMEFGPPQ
ncbi:MAG: hypothetical protein SVU32_05770, partial [Candidatus Nanohaloarchaea archaeon]|nr:hypothetical protein [Candidatus Nanohaloarchaea archaeon]